MAQSHVITINEEIESMANQMKESPKLLRKLAGKESCCIFRVPHCLAEINKEAYRPRIVSIGPYHYGNKDLDMIQEHKWRFLKDFIVRNGKTLGELMDLMVSMEKEIRESYSESIDRFSTSELAKMMVLDGVFLIELFRKVGRLVNTHQDDPIFRMVWVSPFLMRDLLKIENQIPFFVIQKLFDASSTNVDTRTLRALILEFFNYMFHRQPEVLIKYENQEGKHLLDFFRKCFMNTKNRNVASRLSFPSLSLVQSASKLVKCGIKFEASYNADTFLDIEFKNGVLLIPPLNMHEQCIVILNSVAFEQCYSYCSKEITAYVVFMGCLLQTSDDVGLLWKNRVIVNFFGTDVETAKFFHEVGEGMTFNISKNYLLNVTREVNAYCNVTSHVVLGGIKHKYFDSPWASISAFAAFMLLSLAVLQTVFTVYPFFSKRD